MRLQVKTAVVLGGGSGIGQGIAEALADEGCRVAIAGRRAERLAEVARDYRGPTPLLTHTVDVAERESVAQLFQWAAGELGQVDIVVYSAGINVLHRSLADTTPEEWNRLLTTNATGFFHTLQAALPAMRERHDGLVINILSTSGKRASRLGGVAYSASKFALAALGTFATLEEGDHGIRITNIFPGEVETPILDNRPVKVTAEHRARILQPADLGAAVVMIACLPSRAHVAEMVIKPTTQEYA